MRKILWALSALFLALICFVAMNLFVRVRRANERSVIANQIRDLGGMVRYDFDLIQRPPNKGLLWQMFGDDFVGRIVEVNISHRPLRDVDLRVLE
jgi:hypothetical protein